MFYACCVITTFSRFPYGASRRLLLCSREFEREAKKCKVYVRIHAAPTPDRCALNHHLFRRYILKFQVLVEPCRYRTHSHTVGGVQISRHAVHTLRSWGLNFTGGTNNVHKSRYTCVGRVQLKCGMSFDVCWCEIDIRYVRDFSHQICTLLVKMCV